MLLFVRAAWETERPHGMIRDLEERLRVHVFFVRDPELGNVLQGKGGREEELQGSWWNPPPWWNLSLSFPSPCGGRMEMQCGMQYRPRSRPSVGPPRHRRPASSRPAAWRPLRETFVV